MVCKYVQIWLVLVVCNVVWGNFAIKTDIKKSAEICGKSWLRGLNFNRTREVLDLLSLGKNISDLMQRIQTEDMSTQQESGKNT